MPKYKYVARDNTGKVVSGEIAASSQNEVILKLQQQTLIPVTITEISRRKSGSLFASLDDKIQTLSTSIKLKDLVFFTRQLVTFLDAGVTLAKSIKNLADAQKNISFRKVLNQVYSDITGGSDFSEALAKHPKVFDQMYVNIIRAGELSGNLDKALGSLALYKEKSEKMRQSIKSAMMYPKFVAIFTAVIVFVIIWKIIPVFEGLFSSMGGELPAPTQLLVNLSNLLENYFMLVIGGLIVSFIVIKLAFKTKPVRDLWDKFVINAPIFGVLVQQIIVARITSTFALLLESGTPMLQAMEIAGKVADNNEYETSINKAIVDVKNGTELSVSLKRTNRFEDVVIQLTQTGEETGRIDELMQKIANFYDDEVSVKIKGMSSLIEPLLIVVMGVVIGSIVVAIYLPIFTMGDVLG